MRKATAAAGLGPRLFSPTANTVLRGQIYIIGISLVFYIRQGNFYRGGFFLVNYRLFKFAFDCFSGIEPFLRLSFRAF